MKNLNDKDTQLLEAALKGDCERGEQLVLQGADVNARGEFHHTALMKAAARGNTKIIALLLQAGADINAQDYLGKTALMGAIFTQKRDAVQMLVQKGAALDVQDKLLLTPLMLAVKFWVEKDIEIVRILLDAGADINAKDSEGFSALTHAVIFGHDEIVELLLKNEATISQEQDLMRAAASNHTRIAQLLLQHGAKVNATGMYGKTALEFAIEWKHEQMIELLKRHGAK